MVDIAIGSVGKIVEVALKIKEAVETVRQNEKECRDIQRCVARVSALLRKLDETTETMKDETMRDALEDLAESLEHALELVMECHQKHIFRRFLGAGDMAKELGRVHDDIVRKLQLGNFATNVQTTIMVTNIQSAGAPPRPPPPQDRVVIDGFLHFSISELEAATRYFSDINVIGKGSFGTVYKGVLDDGQTVAIKKLALDILVDKESSLYEEINIFLNLDHKNIIRPLGYCHEIKVVLANTGHKYVGAQESRIFFVEEYMPNGSMVDTVYNGTQPIDWSSCFKMIQGIAQGLHYLHEQYVVHMDLKPWNILLDSDLNARIGDFGVAKKLDHGDDEVICDKDTIIGTVGFIAPEYVFHGTVSTKCDLHGFGVTLLWTISTMCIPTRPGIRDLPRWAWQAREDLQMELFNPSLCDKCQLMQIKRCMEIGLLCIETDHRDRPTMVDVLHMLNGEKDLPALKQPYGVDIE